MDGFLTREQAMEKFFNAWQPTYCQELVTLDECVGRVLAKDVISNVDLPVYRSSSCDGIAVRSKDFLEGIPDTREWKYGVDYVRADTGDDFDDKFDAVIMIEKVQTDSDGCITLDDNVDVKPGTNVNPKGSTISKGDAVLSAGVIIRPTDLAAICIAGTSMVYVRKRPKIAFIPTGSELVAAGIKPKRGEMIDCNSLLIKHMLLSFGAEPIIFPIVKDDPQELENAFENALEIADAVIINGGSALGEEDHNIRIIEEHGEIINHYVSAAPGRPIMFAVADGKPVIDLPGPTMAAYYCANWCLKPLVCRMLDIPVPQRQTIVATSTEDYKTFKDFAILGRWNVCAKDDGSYEATPRNFKKSITDALTSNAYRVSDIGDEPIAAGDEIVLELLRGQEWIN